MQSLENNPLRLSRAGLLMLTWGVAIVIAGGLTQWVRFSSLDSILHLWGAVTLVGVAVQVVCQVRDQGFNCAAWVAALAIGWAFTFYVIDFENGAHLNLYGDLAGVWLILFGLAYVDTARRIDSRFLWLAELHLAVGGLMELSAHGIVGVPIISPLLNSYGSLIFGLVSGAPLIVASAFARVKVEQPRLDASLSPQQQV
jgi:hypothetical protein